MSPKAVARTTDRIIAHTAQLSAPEAVPTTARHDDSVAMSFEATGSESVYRPAISEIPSTFCTFATTDPDLR